MQIFNSKSSSKKNKKVFVNQAEVIGESGGERKSSTTDTSVELRSIPGDVARAFGTEVVGGVMDGFLRQLLGQPMVGKEAHPESMPDANMEALMWKKKFQLAERRRAEEKALYLKKEQENQQKIVSIRQQLQIEVASFTQDMSGWAREMEIATFQSPVAPSIYHEGFFEKLMSFVKNLRKQVRNSKIWLRARNVKSAKQKGLWGLAQKKSGAFDQEILFSEERAVSMAG